MKAVLIAAVVSLVIALFGTPMFIRFLVRKGYGQFIRDDGPTSHHTKRGTPTMGGAVIVAARSRVRDRPPPSPARPPTVSGLLVLFLMSGLGFVGFLDDFIKISKQRSLGLRTGEKLAGPDARRGGLRDPRAAVPQRVVPHAGVDVGLVRARHAARPRVHWARSSASSSSSSGPTSSSPARRTA